MEQGEIVLYQPDEAVKLEVRLEDDTVWLTQEQIAALFGTKRPAITKHLNNIYKSGELDVDSTCSILEHMGNDSKQKYITKYYNLDAILSIGYRVNSKNATLFRRWANSVLKLTSSSVLPFPRLRESSLKVRSSMPTSSLRSLSSRPSVPFC